MKKGVIIVLLGLMLFGCQKKEKQLILSAELDCFFIKEEIKLYDDNTYIADKTFQGRSKDNTTLKGNYSITNDTIILSGEFNFKGFIKNNYLEYAEEYAKFKILTSELNQNIKTDLSRFTNYSFFTYKNDDKYFNDTNRIYYDLTQEDLKSIDSLLVVCMNQSGSFINRKSFDDYLKCGVATQKPNGEIEIYLACKHISDKPTDCKEHTIPMILD